MGAFGYLIWTSWRNRIVSQIRRVRTPRYAIALIVGGLYIWWFFFRPTQQVGGAAGSVFLGRGMQFVAIVFVVMSTLSAWVFGSDRMALAFSQAEVSFLFAAPVSRRSLIVYKLFRAQLAVLRNAVSWVFILRRGGTTLPSPLRAIALWTMFSTLNLHRLGAALVRASWTEHRAAGVRRQRLSIAVFLVIAACVVYSLVQQRALLFAATGPQAMFNAILDALATAPAGIALYPFRAVIAPTFTQSVAEWEQALLPALVMLLFHAWWVLRTDAAFEDAAIEASAERARRLELLRERRGASAVTPRTSPARTLPLAAVGHPAVAIVWKNTLCFFRTSQSRMFLTPAVLGIVLGVTIVGARSDPMRIVGACAAGLFTTMFFFGWRMIRNDLRHDMLHLPFLKALPVAPAEIVIAEIVSAAIPIVVVQLACVIIAFVAAMFMARPPFSPERRVMLLIVAPFVVAAINAALLTIQNATAVLFPAWIRLGPTIAGGVEALGQNVLSFAGAVLCLGVALILPTLVGGVVFTTLEAQNTLAIGAAVIAGSGVLAAETYFVAQLLGRAFARAEPSATT